MEWFYADGQDRRGPVTEEQFRGLIAAGSIKPENLVWHQGMAQWQPLREIAPDPGPPPLGAGATAQRCFITGQFFPTSQMIQTEHGWVSAGARDTYYQCLRENVPFPVAAGMSNARSDGKRILLPRQNPVLPRRCIKTNQPVTEADTKRKKLYWCPPWIAILLLLNLLIFLIVYLVVRKPFVIDIPLSAAGRKIVRKHALIAWGLFVAGVACFIVAIANNALVALILPGLALALSALIYGVAKGTTLRIVKFTTHEASLKGACPEFLASLPKA